MKDNYFFSFKYEDFGLLFIVKFFNVNQWVDIFQVFGVKYIVLIFKYYEGFILWGLEYLWNWNVIDEGFKRDIVKEFEVVIRNRIDLCFGLYYFFFEWFYLFFFEDEFSLFYKW